MTRTLPKLAVFFSGFFLLGCGSAQTVPAAPQDQQPEPEALESTEPASPDRAPSADEIWEGEAEATSEGPGVPGSTGAVAVGADRSRDEPVSQANQRVETRTTEVVALVIRENRKRFRDCYEQGAKDRPDLQGTLTLHFVLDPRGKVKHAEVNAERSTIVEPSIDQCAISVLKTLTFPPSSRGMESSVNYPFDFKR